MAVCKLILPQIQNKTMAKKAVKAASKRTICLLDKVMKERGINQQELSDATGVTRTTIRKLQNNLFILLPIDQVDIICDHLGIELWDIFERIEVR